MAIRVRRGLEEEFDPSKLLAGEWAVTIDPETERQKVYMCFGAGIVKQMGTYNDFQQMIEEIADDLLEDFKKEIQPIKTEIEQMASDVSSDKAEVVVIKNDITDRILPLIEGYVESAEGFAESAGASSDNAKTYAENALSSAEVSNSFAVLAESYAKGGTGTREGEDADNAKKYMERAEQAAREAEQAAGGDFVTHAEVGVTVAQLVNGKVPESQLPEIGDKVEVDGTTITQNPDTKVISVAKDITDKVGEVDKIKEDLSSHIDASIVSEEGVHDIRYNTEEEVLQAYVDGEWVDCGGGVPSKSVINFTTTTLQGKDIALDGEVVTTFSDEGLASYVARELKEYTFECDGYTATVNVTAFGVFYSANIDEPSWSIKNWCKSGGVTEHNSLDDIPEVDMRKLMTLHTSVDYLKEWMTEDSSIIDTFVANSNAMKWMGLRDYAYDTLTSVGTKNLLNPTMQTTTQNGITCTNNGDGTYTLNGMNTSSSVLYLTIANLNLNSGVYKLVGCPKNGSSTTYRISIEGTSYVDSGEGVQFEIDSRNIYISFCISPNTKCDNLVFKTMITTNLNATYDDFVRISTFEDKLFASDNWEYALKDHVPVMTSDTAPYGEASSSSKYKDGYYPFLSFNDDETVRWVSATSSGNEYLQYKFTNPTCIKAVYIKELYYSASSPGDGFKNAKIQASNDGVTWDSLDSWTNNDNVQITFRKFNNQKYYVYYRFLCVDFQATGNKTLGILRLQFYGRSLNVSSNDVGTLPPQTEHKVTIGGVTYWTNKTEREFEEGSTIKYIYDHGVELEPVEPVTETGKCEKQDERLYIKCNNGNALFYASSKIDLYNYNLIRAIVDDTYDVATSIADSIIVRREKTVSGSGGVTIGYTKFDHLPYGHSMDISEITESAYVGVMQHTTGTMTINEWWLE